MTTPSPASDTPTAGRAPTLPIAWPEVDCCAGNEENCLCGPQERVLRAFIDGRLTSPMTPEQREYCLSEIHSVEGYDRKDHERDTDMTLATNVLGAWQDYCEDKGLL